MSSYEAVRILFDCSVDISLSIHVVEDQKGELDSLKFYKLHNDKLQELPMEHPMIEILNPDFSDISTPQHHLFSLNVSAMEVPVLLKKHVAEDDKFMAFLGNRNDYLRRITVKLDEPVSLECLVLDEKTGRTTTKELVCPNEFVQNMKKIVNNQI